MYIAGSLHGDRSREAAVASTPPEQPPEAPRVPRRPDRLPPHPSPNPIHVPMDPPRPCPLHLQGLRLRSPPLQDLHPHRRLHRPQSHLLSPQPQAHPPLPGHPPPLRLQPPHPPRPHLHLSHTQQAGHRRHLQPQPHLRVPLPHPHGPIDQKQAGGPKEDGKIPEPRRPRGVPRGDHVPRALPAPLQPAVRRADGRGNPRRTGDDGLHVLRDDGQRVQVAGPLLLHDEPKP